ncbi:MAG TPA: response regulator transcription factor [Ignavibacteria bacterium]|nr:response regulator transcription factor [Ignavibacteria bacterium]
MIKVLIVEDDKVIRNELKDLINSDDDIECIGDFESCELALEFLKNSIPDVILMDISLPGIDGIRGMKQILEKYSEIDFIMLTVHSDSELIFKAIKSGACGYLDKSATEQKIIDSIKEVFYGGAPMTSRIAKLVVESFRHKQIQNEDSSLSNRETDVLDLLCKGKTYKEISSSLNITVGTVRHHIKNVYRKLHVHSKSEAVAKAFKDNLI